MSIINKILKNRVEGLIKVHEMTKMHEQELYKFSFLKNLSINILIDIGANEGQFAARVRNCNNEIQIFSFEPILNCYNEIIKKFANDNKFVAYNYAIGSKSDIIDINVNEYSPSSSILEMEESHKNLFSFARKHHKETIKLKRLDYFMAEFIPFGVSCVKIDVQGFELEVLNGIGEYIDYVKVILLEVSFVNLYKNQPLFEDVNHYIIKMGFTFRGFFDQLFDENLGIPVQADAIYIRNL